MAGIIKAPSKTSEIRISTAKKGTLEIGVLTLVGLMMTLSKRKICCDPFMAAVRYWLQKLKQSGCNLVLAIRKQ